MFSDENRTNIMNFDFSQEILISDNFWLRNEMMASGDVNAQWLVVNFGHFLAPKLENT